MITLQEAFEHNVERLDDRRTAKRISKKAKAKFAHLSLTKLQKEMKRRGIERVTQSFVRWVQGLECDDATVEDCALWYCLHYRVAHAMTPAELEMPSFPPEFREMAREMYLGLRQY